MIDFSDFLLFLGLSWVLIITPGPDLLYVLTRGISNGRKAGFISAAGVTLGIFVHTIFAALGLSIILQTSALAFSIVKLVGAGYLIYLGIKSFTGTSDMKVEKEQRTSNRKLFMQGLISNTLNPKVALFFMAFLPQFIDTSAGGNMTFQFLLLGSVFAFCGLLFLCALGYFSGSIGQYINRNPAMARWVNRISGTILLLLGVRLAFLRQK